MVPLSYVKPNNFYVVYWQTFKVPLKHFGLKFLFSDPEYHEILVQFCNFLRNR